MTTTKAARTAGHTPGPVKVERAKHPDNTGGYDYAVSDQDNCIIAECFQRVGYAGGTAKEYIEFPAAENAALIAEAFNLATETGLTPLGLLALANRHRADSQRLLEQKAELLSALIGLLPKTFTGAPDRKNEIAHWERERALGNGRAPLVLAAFAAISRATVKP